MADIVAKAPAVDKVQARTQRIAWGVLLASFVIFTVICVTSGIGIYYFLFKSTIPMRVELSVGRGTTILTPINAEPIPERDSRLVANRSALSTDSVGQSMLTIYDSDQPNDRPAIATITMTSDTSISVEEVSRPRFDWSTTSYVIWLDHLVGRIEIMIPDAMTSSMDMTVKTNDGTVVRLLQSGRYAITANSAQVRVEVYDGAAELQDGDYSYMLHDGERVMYSPQSQEQTLLSPYVRLLGTSTFDETNVFASNAQSSSSAWYCYNLQNDQVPGTFGLTLADGRPALRLSRFGSVNHGETNCISSVGASVLDVTNYAYLSIEVTFRIDNQSLSACGDAGSECPLMIQLDYQPVDTDGGSPPAALKWNHGFYLWNAIPTLPLTCSTCTSEHEIVNSGVWYRYRSDNLLAFLSAERRPARIIALRVYAQGHEYDTYVSEAALYASERIDPVPLGDPSLQG